MVHKISVMHSNHSRKRDVGCACLEDLSHMLLEWWDKWSRVLQRQRGQWSVLNGTLLHSDILEPSTNLMKETFIIILSWLPNKLVTIDRTPSSLKSWATLLTVLMQSGRCLCCCTELKLNHLKVFFFLKLTGTSDPFVCSAFQITVQFRVIWVNLIVAWQRAQIPNVGLVTTFPARCAPLRTKCQY